MRSIWGVFPCIELLREREQGGEKGGETIHRKEWVCGRSKGKQARQQRRKPGRDGKEELGILTQGKESHHQHQILILHTVFGDLKFLLCSIEPHYF